VAAVEAERVRGLRELGSALALEPSNEETLGTLMRFLLEPAGDLPPQAEAELAELVNRDRPRGARDAMRAYAFMGLTGPVLLMMPVLRPGLFALLVAAIVATAAYLGWMWRTGNAGPRFMGWALPLSFTVVGLTSALFGPFVMVPGTAVVTVATLLINLRANPAVRRAAPLLGLAAVFVPTLLQIAGLAPRSYAFDRGSIRIVSDMVEFRPFPAFLMLALGSALTIVAASFTIGRAVDALVASERRSFAQAWRLRQILPGGGQRTAR